MAIKVSGTEVISDDKRILNNESLPDIRPSLLLDFANSKTLDPRITFTRGSTATYWDGKTTAKAEENLFLYSQAFEATNSSGNWSTQSATVTDNDATAPNGTTTAAKLQGNGVSTEHRVITASANNTTVQSCTGQFAFSIFAKAGTNDYIQFRTSQSDSGYANFDISSGTAHPTAASASITDVGSGWYRCEIIFADSATTPSNISVHLVTGTSASRAEVNTLSTYVHLWGAQLEQRSSATAYTPTTTSPIVKYQPVLQTAASGGARFDHDPVTGESKGLLIEEARTNVYTYSVLTSANWEEVRATLEDASTVAPDGTLTAAKLTEDTQNGTHYAKISTNIPTTATYTLSFYVKAAERDEVGVWFGGASQSPQSRVHFDLTNETMALISGTANVAYGMDAVGNGWYRVWLSDEVGAASAFAPIVALVKDNTYNYTGDGYSGIYVWGAQIEAGSFPTSYIPTSGSTVTRAQELASMTGTNFSDWYDNSRGFTMFAHIGDKGGWDSKETYGRIWSMSDGTDNNFIEVYSQIVANTDKWRYRVDALGVDNSVLANNYTAVSIADNQKIAIALGTDDFGISIDGQSVNTDTSTPLPTLNELSIGSRSYNNILGTDTVTTGTIKKLAFYPKRLPNATLQAMTEE